MRGGWRKVQPISYRLHALKARLAAGHWGDAASVAGVLISIIGFAVVTDVRRQLSLQGVAVDLHTGHRAERYAHDDSGGCSAGDWRAKMNTRPNTGTEEKILKLVQRLAKTKADEMPWEQTTRAGVFQVVLQNHIVKLSTRPNAENDQALDECSLHPKRVWQCHRMCDRC